ncbi:MAG TPA: TPM domain-containing protein, partial [Gemmatimonadaceae bacterium]
MLRRALALLISAVVSVAAQSPGLQIPAPVGYVNDFAHVISPSSASAIERIIDDVRAKSGGEIVVVTLPDLGGRPVEEVGLAIGRQWKIGQNGKPGDPARNRGVVILVVPKETSHDGRGYVRTEVGLGSEGFITDAATGQFRDEAIPYFQRRDYGGGIELMTQRVAERFANEFHFQIDTSLAAPPPPPQATTQRRRNGIGIPPFVWVLLLFFILSSLSGRGRRRGCLPFFIPMGGGGGWGGGGFGG